MLKTPRLATTQDTDAIISLRLESEEWLHAAGVDQWHDTQRGIGNIRDGIASGTTWVVDDPEDGVAGTLTLNGADPDFWKPDEGNGALFLYKFMIHKRWRGTGLGDEILDWACARVEEVGRWWLRLDCWRSNTALQRYYMHRGFDHVRTVVVDGRGSGALFERAAHIRTAAKHRWMARHP